MKKILLFTFIVSITSLCQARILFYTPGSWADACDRIKMDIAQFIQYASLEDIRKLKKFIRNEGKPTSKKPLVIGQPLIILEQNILAQIPTVKDDIRTQDHVNHYFNCIDAYIELYLTINRPEYNIEEPSQPEKERIK
ncbi:MAG: hypothetical protein WA432_03905 [Candidatus Babeliaceae bacterium]